MERKLMAVLRTACSNNRSTGLPSARNTSILVSAGDPRCAAWVSMIHVWPALASKRNRSASDPALELGLASGAGEWFTLSPEAGGEGRDEGAVSFGWLATDPSPLPSPPRRGRGKG